MVPDFAPGFGQAAPRRSPRGGVGRERRCPIRITALGHSCLLLDFKSEETGQHTRILVDPWLSDHATGDAMGRFPRLRFDVAALGPIDAVYLSHAHSDHLDPYTLVRLWRELPTPPVLLLPISLAFLLPVFREFLDAPEMQVLEPHIPTPFRGVQLLGLYDVADEPTNEDDVMVLVVSSGSEVALVEADARLSLELVRFREYITMLLRGPGITSAVYLSTENELTGTLEGRSCATTEEREELAAYATSEMLEAVEELYIQVDDPDDLWHGAHVLRLVHGQGLTAPHELDPRWQRILFPVRVEDRVRAERAAAERSGFEHHIDSLTVGCVHTIVAGRVQSREPLAGLELLDREDQRTFDPQLPFFPFLPCAPLRFDSRDVASQRARVLALLNERFLPYLHGLRRPPVLHLLASAGGSYRIRVRYGTALDAPSWDYALGFDARDFIEVAPSDDEPHEAYWANDLDDMVTGRCDEFSPFCRSQLPNMDMRLWTCLATPLLNSDIVLLRVQLHFERAAAGLTPGSFVLELYAPSGDDG
ncbi:MAG: hypothetical protein ACI8PZ_003896 [Myxococcota bacterium]|jgi:hypothetical protein